MITFDQPGNAGTDVRRQRCGEQIRRFDQLRRVGSGEMHSGAYAFDESCLLVDEHSRSMGWAPNEPASSTP
ncbi:hypothetical protein [Nocardia wallacei]|uniref:hypothetical protein n=1 Tax=Nocardia wallacei TaxID=480035 RepID=UPI001656F9C4|nr:hypothetical protein [Nocardia wallacei]